MYWIDILDPVTILLFLIVLWLTYIYMTWPYRYFEKHGIPCDPPVPFFGNWKELGKKSLEHLDREMIERHGKILGCYNGWIPEIIVADLDLIKQFTIKDSDKFTDRRDFLLRGILKYSVLESTGENWKRQRSLVTPFFSSGKLKINFKIINTIADNLVQHIRESEKNEFEGKHISSCVTLDVICRAGFGIDVESIKNPNHPLVKNIIDLVSDFSPGNPWFLLTFFCPGVSKLLQKFDISMFKNKTVSYLRQLTISIIQRKEQGDRIANEFVTALVKAHEEELDYESKTALGNISNVKRKGMTEKEILSNAIIFIAAGYDTTATGLSFLLFLLTVNESCQQTLYEEIQKNVGEEVPTYESILQMNYLDWCVAETLRIYPPAPRFDRQCTTTTKLGDFTIPKGMLVTVPIWYLHHDPEVWPNPEKFDPLRFSPEIKKNRNPLNWMPFGNGQRRCVGERLAILEMKMVPVKILQRFKLVKNKKTVPIKLLPSALFSTAKDGLWFSVEPRK